MSTFLSMKTLSQCFFVILLLTLMLGCKKENNPVLSTESLPQGFAVNNDFSTFNSVTALSNGEIVIAGTLKEGKKLGLLKLDKDCNEIWSKSYFEVDYLNTVKVVKQRNDDLIITGTLDSNTSIASLDKDGNEIWCHKNILEVGIEGINPIQTMDNGILVAVTVDTGFVNVVKYDDLGEEL